MLSLTSPSTTNDAKSIHPTKQLPSTIHTIIPYFDSLLLNNTDLAIAIAAIQSLIHVIECTTANTLMELQLELRACSDELLKSKYAQLHNAAIQSGCVLLQRNITRYANQILNDTDSTTQDDFAAMKKTILDKANEFAHKSLQARQTIARTLTNTLFQRHTRSSRPVNVLIHGYSRVVMHALLKANKCNKQFKAYICAGLPNTDSQLAYSALQSAHVDCVLINDTAVAYYMQSIDYVLVGAESVTENGGCINKIGTLNIAVVAAAFSKPVYVLAETYKFVRMYPLQQSDICANVDSNNPLLDYTKPEHISLLFTDIGILSPNSVSDELIKLYY